MKTLEQIVWVLQVYGFALGAAVLFAYWIFRKSSEKWLETKFQERLASYKHAQQRELEQLRLKINTLFDRTTKLHVREFEVLPEAWAKLNDAFWKTMSFTSQLQTHPDIDKMSPAHLQEFLEGCLLGNWEKEEIKTVSDKNAYYIKHIFWARLVDTRTTVTDAHTYIIKNGIFLPEDLKERFTDLSEIIWEALAESQRNKQFDMKPEVMVKQLHLQDKGQDLLKKLEAKVYERLWSSQDGNDTV